jgi:hypothetical protein
MCRLLAIVLVLAGGASAVKATPLPGELPSFQQLPLNGGLAPSTGGAPFRGHSELSTAVSDLIGLTFAGTYVADDFSHSLAAPIVHVEWWGSYLSQGNPNGVRAFLIAFESANGNHPGNPILSQIVTEGALSSGSGTFTETAIPTPGGAPQLYQYNAELQLPFLQVPDQVYWLKIVALVDPDTDGAMQWGWQNRDYEITDPVASSVPVPGEQNLPNGLGIDMWHFRDTAVTGNVSVIPLPGAGLAIVNQSGGYTPRMYVNGTDGPTGINAFGQDMAFALYATPEPGTIALLGTGGIALLATLVRRRRP